MMAFTLGNEDPIKMEIARILGIKGITELHIHMALDSITELEVKYFADIDQMGKIAEVMRKYHLVPIKEEKDGNGD